MLGNLLLRNGEKVLFIGDSITDCGRRETERPLGSGYVSLFVELQRAIFPRRRITYVNKGISGQTVLELRQRWHDDVIRERPDWLSVAIGINDCHRWLNGLEAHSPERFRDDYDAILTAAREKTRARLLLIDPFYISTDRTGLGIRSEVLKVLPRYITAVHEMARKYRARLVRTHEMFQRRLKYTAPEVFCPEPVHPNRCGHLCIAWAVMRALTRP